MASAGRGADIAVELESAVASARPRRRGRAGARRRDDLVAYVFLAPWLLGLVGITLGPLLASLALSFTRYDLLSTPRWAGIANYQRMVSGDPSFMQSLGVTVLYVVVSVPSVLVISLALALLLNRGLRGLTLYRALFYLPSLLGGSVAIAVLWRQVFGIGGMLNQILALVHIRGQSWIGSPSTALYTLVALNVWQFGATMIIFLAGLRQIPESLYDAAAVDGARWWRRFWHITIPMLSPVIFFNAVLGLIRAFQVFTPAYVVSNGTGGPAGSMLLYALYLYQQGFVHYNMGYAAAMAWVLVIVIAALTGGAFLSARYWVYYGDQG
ncbi:MAG TPA: sugar ABC transporter permease [bacterium]|nr:sugar ABC transporter permease [bacterium]